MKHYITMISLFCSLLLVVPGCSTDSPESHSTPPAPTSSDSLEFATTSEAQKSLADAISPDDTDDTDAPYMVIDDFVAEYNAVAVGEQIKDTIEIDINDKDSGYYRTEFRLTAFEDAPAKHGIMDGATIDMINYGALWKDGFRIYVSADSVETLKTIFETSVNIFEGSIESDQIQKIFDTADGWHTYSFTLGNNLTGTYNSTEPPYSFMLDDGRYTAHKAEQ